MFVVKLRYTVQEPPGYRDMLYESQVIPEMCSIKATGYSTADESCIWMQ